MTAEERADAQRMFRKGRLVGARDAENLARSYRAKAAQQTAQRTRQERIDRLEAAMNAELEMARAAEIARRDEIERIKEESRGPFDPDELALLIVGTVAVGALVGWIWRKRRLKKVQAGGQSAKPSDVVGLDVILGSR